MDINSPTKKESMKFRAVKKTKKTKRPKKHFCWIKLYSFSLSGVAAQEPAKEAQRTPQWPYAPKRSSRKASEAFQRWVLWNCSLVGCILWRIYGCFVCLHQESRGSLVLKRVHDVLRYFWTGFPLTRDTVKSFFVISYVS